MIDKKMIMKYYIRFVLLFMLLVPVRLLSQESNTIDIEPDNEVILRNPMSGWVVYMGRGGWDSTFWTEQKYDNMPVNGTDETVSVSDYASCAYLRAAWSFFEPSEGVYAWRDETTRCYRLIKSARDRGLRLSFRIIVDGRDQGQNTPEYVFTAGAKYYENSVGSKTVKSPYPDDAVFQEKYENFIKAFAEDFNDPDIVDFVDGYGFGLWGEGHQVVYLDSNNKLSVYDWITSLYSGVFTKVPLLMNYHRVLGDGVEWTETPNADTENMIESAVAKGYSLRHDAFGMNGYYKAWEKSIAAEYYGKRPVVMEGGWVTNNMRYWIDPSGDYREGFPGDVRLGEYKASKEAHVNMMDLRVNEVPSWFENFDLVKGMCLEGGYRLYPDRITMPKTVVAGNDVTIIHRWNNTGWGYCPTNIPQWNQKYKVAFALLDENGNVKKTMVEKASDLSTWIKGTPVSYTSSFAIDDIETGSYTLAVGLVDVTKDNAIGLQMAVAPGKLVNGWYPLGELAVVKDGYFVRSDDDVRLADAAERDGASWETALKFSDFYKNINNYATGDKFYFAGGDYFIPSVVGITKGYTFIGGFDPASTGTEHTLPSYPSSHPTVFTCKENNKLARLIPFTTPATADEPVRLTGLDFTGAYNPASAPSTAPIGALWFRDRKDVVVSNCRFYGNVSDTDYGGMALTSETSTVRLVDCEFYGNRAGARGGAIRMSSKSQTEGYTTLERCAVYDNSVTNKTLANGLGSAVCMQHGQALYIVNSTISGNISETGGAVFSNGDDGTYRRAIYVVNSTIAGNTGNQIQMTQGANLYLLNSIVVGKEADGSIANAAIAITGTAEKTAFDVTSKGYNMLGNYMNQVSNASKVPVWDGSDAISVNNTYESLFGDNKLQDGVIVPLHVPNGATIPELSAAACDWNLNTVTDGYLFTDQKGNMRGDMTPGALAAEGEKGILSITSNGVTTYYDDYGYRLPLGVKGCFIADYDNVTHKLDMTDMYNGNDEVPSKSALLLMGAEGDYGIDLKLSKSYGGDAGNLLQGTQTEAITVSDLDDVCFYKLADGEKGLGFYWGTPDGGAFLNDAHRAYLVTPSSSYAKFFLLPGTTGIEDSQMDKLPKDKVYYTLQGVKTSGSIAPGIYITERKKIIIR